MSQSFSSQFKQWVSAVQSGHLRRVNQELTNYIFQENEESISKSMMKLLIYLCQTATKFSEKDHEKGSELYDLCKTICRNFKVISNTTNFFSSLFHIIRVLLDMGLFSNAMKVCDYLLPKSMWHKEMRKEHSEVDTKYLKLWSIFYTSIDKHLKSKKPGSLTDTSFRQLLTLIEYQLNIELLSNPDGSKGMLLKLLHYADLFERAQCTKEELDEFNNRFFIKYLGSIKLNLGIKNKLATYQHFTKIIIKITLVHIKNKEVGILQDILRKVLKNFDNCVNEDPEIQGCYQQCKEFCEIFAMPLTDFSRQNPDNINQLIIKLQQHINTYSKEGAIKYNIYSHSTILDALQSSWIESFSQSESCEYWMKDLIMNSAEMLDYHSEIIGTYESGIPCNCSSNCRAHDDQNKAAHLKMKILHLLQRFSQKYHFSIRLFKQFKDISVNSVNILQDLQEFDCQNWKNLWYYVGNSIYTLAVHFGSENYHESQELYLLLYKSIIKLKATTAETTIFRNNPTPPLSNVLHRLSNLHYSNKYYNEAKLFAALNVYLHPLNSDCKGYRNWAFVKYYQMNVRGTTLVDFFTETQCQMEPLELEKIKLNNEDLKEICIRELKSYIEVELDMSSAVIAVINCLNTLNTDLVTYTTAVHQMGYYFLNFSSGTSIMNYIEKVKRKLDLEKIDNTTYDYLQYLTSHLKLYEIVEEIREIEEATKTEMKDAKFNLYASSSTESDKGANVVPTYSQINVVIAKTIESKFEELYNLWKKCFVGESFIKWNSADGTSTVRCVIVAGEYCKLYRYKNLEIKFWKLAYKLAIRNNDYRCIVYITGRSIMSRYIDESWIEKAENTISTKLNESKDLNVLSTIAMFKMSLSDYYYYIGNREKADILFDEGLHITTLDMGTNPGTFIFSKYIMLTHQFHKYPDEMKNDFEYAKIIAPSLYGMLTSDDMFKSLKSTERYLYEMDLLLEATCQFAVRMNAVFSYREISAHLVRRLNICQTKISILRVAEILKYLCIIDLSRHQLDDCEVKLQGLEHILKIDTLGKSMQSDNLKTANSFPFSTTMFPNGVLGDPIRDVAVNDTSPILRREQFFQPHFISHSEKCECFKCTNEAYKLSVFSCTHIRAQLYNLRNLTEYAQQYFEGALQISKKLLDLLRKENNYQQGQIIDYILFLLDYARFLKRHSRTYEKGEMYACSALEICDIYSLDCHPIYISAVEIVHEYHFERVFRDGFAKSSLIGSTSGGIDVNDDFEANDLEIIEGFCVTPTREIGENLRPIGSPLPRRNLVPKLPFNIITIDVPDSDDDAISPYPQKSAVPQKKKITTVKPIRRKLAEDDDFNEPIQQKYGTLPMASSKSRTHSAQIKTYAKDCRPRLSTLIDQIIPINPGASRKLHALRKKSTDHPVGDDELKKLIDILDEKKTDSRRLIGASRARRALGDFGVPNAHVKELDDMVDMLKEMLAVNSDNSTNTITKSSEQCSKAFNVTEPQPENSEDLNLQSLTRKVEKLSVQPSSSLIVPIIQVDHSMELVKSDDEIVECSIIEPRRSRRLAGKKTTTDTKFTRNRL